MAKAPKSDSDSGANKIADARARKRIRDLVAQLDKPAAERDVGSDGPVVYDAESKDVSEDGE